MHTVHFFWRNMKYYKAVVFLLFTLFIGIGCSTSIGEVQVDTVPVDTVPVDMVPGDAAPVEAAQVIEPKVEQVAMDMAGTWEGLLKIQPGVEMKLLFNIEKTNDGYTAVLAIPQQGVTGLPVQTATLSETGEVDLVIASIGARFTGTMQGHDATVSIEGVFEQSGFKFPLVLSPSLQSAPTGKPQDPVPPYPYISEEVEFVQQPDGFTLAGTITRPKATGKYPAVVLVTGSGSQDRDEAIMGHRPFLVLSDALTKAGIVVLRYDDRGFAQSKGDASAATTMDFAMDAASAVSYLASQPYVDKSRIGVLGHSEGGVIAPIVASDNPEVDFIILMAGTGVNGIELLKDQSAAILRTQGAPEAYINQITALNESIYRMIIEPSADMEDQKRKVAEKLTSIGVGPDEVKAQIAALFSPWYRYFLMLDPAVYLEKTTVPVLILNGSKDTQVTSALNVPAIEAALQRGGNMQSTTIVYDGLNHLFQPAQTGAVAEYATIETTIEPQVLNDIATWILQR